MTKDEIQALVVSVAEKHGLDHNLVLAMCDVESGFNPNKNRYEPNFKWLKLPGGYALKNNISFQTEVTNQSISWGLLQVMGALARDQGFNGDLPELCSNVELGLDHGCLYLKHQLAKYQNNVNDALAAYNAGSAVKKADGHYENQAYVDKVNSVLTAKKVGLT